MQEVELASHQRKAVARLHNGSILTGGVGTGKTRVAMRYYIEKEAPKRVIVITTAKKRDSLDWEGEAVLHGVGTSVDATISGVLTVDSWNNLWKYIDIQDAFFIFDEQRLVGSGKWVKSFYKIAKHNRWILLSATPGDTWLDYIPVFVANGFYKNQTDFQREHVVYSRYSKFPKVEKFIGVSQLVKHRNSLLVDMPYQRHTTRVLKDVLVDYDKTIFDKVVKKRWHVFEERPLRDVAELYSVMRKTVNSDPSRLSAVRKLMTDHPRLIVFYNFDYELEILRSLGDTSQASIQPVMENSSSESLSKERDGVSHSGLSSTPSPATGTSSNPSQILAREKLKQKAAGWPNSFGKPDTTSLQSKSSTSTMLQDSSSPWSPRTSLMPSATGNETKPPNPSLCLWNSNRSCICLETRQEMCLSSYRNEKGDGLIRNAHYQAQMARIAGGTLGLKEDGDIDARRHSTSNSSSHPSLQSVAIAENLALSNHLRRGLTTVPHSSETQSAWDQSVSIAEWNGHKHEEIPQTDRWVYLVQYTAGAEGWNCTATDTVVFYSLNYSYRIFEQCQGRIDRLNTPFKVLTYYILKSDSWIDKMIWKAVQLKKTFNERGAMKELAIM